MWTECECEYSCTPVSADSVSMVTVSAVYFGLNKNWKIKEINGP
jgi:hypothetical protein